MGACLMRVMYKKGCVMIVMIERQLTRLISEGIEWPRVLSS